ncbi:MAG: 2-oxo acid dehydrogenase subunit E2 [Bryobacteraceae bacterium]|nr:2-oxo acid dehydrogenase subunit E2 [Bryobacteraceae bacterium]
MAIEITVPRLGWSMEEGIFGNWLKANGDTVSAGEPLFSLESDKVTMDVEALDSGVLHILATSPQPGDVVTVGQLLGHLLREGESVPVVSSPERTPVSPRARAVAKELGVDLAQVQPRPGKQRIIAADVQKIARPLPHRVTVATRMEESFRAPHFYLHADADAEALAHYRDQRRPLSYNDLLLKAIALALTRHPRVNAYWANDGVVARVTHHVALAAQVGEQLLTPVIPNPAEKSLAQITADRLEVLERCRQRTTRPADFADASATLSNLGPFGVDRFQAILNPPQSIIVAAGSIRKRPVVVGDAVVARLTLPISLSVDHRVVDGVAAAAFLQTLIAILEAPGATGESWG